MLLTAKVGSARLVVVDVVRARNPVLGWMSSGSGVDGSDFGLPLFSVAAVL